MSLFNSFLKSQFKFIKNVLWKIHSMGMLGLDMIQKTGNIYNNPTFNYPTFDYTYNIHLQSL